jgi:hypothetical protein
VQDFFQGQENITSQIHIPDGVFDSDHVVVGGVAN